MTWLRLLLFTCPFVLAAAEPATASAGAPRPVPSTPLTEKALGIYIHLGWSYHHPYAARTWTLDDWRGYLDGIRRLGYNTVLIWPLLETMPDPLTPSDEALLAKIAAVIDLAHRDFGQKVHLVLCPNVAANDVEAAKSGFEQRLFYHCDRRVDPGDPIAFGEVMAWREKLLRPLGRLDGLFVIDSDPGGFPHSTDLEFIYILGAHRRVLDRFGPGKELYYWAHAGWEAYARYYATAQFKMAEPRELAATVALLARQHAEPWGVATRYPDLADTIGMGERVLAYPYGAIEPEPSFPLTSYQQPRLLAGARRAGPRGIMGNVQTPCMQLPNTFAFARIALGKGVEKSDYIDFANDLLPGGGAVIVEAWEALQGADTARLEEAGRRVETLRGRNLPPGPLQGLLFGEPVRFLDDLGLQLRLVAATRALNEALDAQPRSPARVEATLRAFLDRAERWQRQHGYTDVWFWPPLNEALAKLDSVSVNQVLKTRDPASGEGATAPERIANRRARLETYTLQLIAALKQTVDAMHQ